MHALGAKKAGAIAWLMVGPDVGNTDPLPGAYAKAWWPGDTRASVGIPAADISQGAADLLVDALLRGEIVLGTLEAGSSPNGWATFWATPGAWAWRVVLIFLSIAVIEVALCRLYAFVQADRSVRPTLAQALLALEAAAHVLRLVFLAVDPFYASGLLAAPAAAALSSQAVAVSAVNVALFLMYFASAAASAGLASLRLTKPAYRWALVGFAVLILALQLFTTSALASVLPILLLVLCILTERRVVRGLQGLPASLVSILVRRMRVSIFFSLVALIAGLALPYSRFRPGRLVLVYSIAALAQAGLSFTIVAAFKPLGARIPRGPISLGASMLRDFARRCTGSRSCPGTPATHPDDASAARSNASVTPSSDAAARPTTRRRLSEGSPPLEKARASPLQAEAEAEEVGEAEDAEAGADARAGGASAGGGSGHNSGQSGAVGARTAGADEGAPPVAGFLSPVRLPSVAPLPKRPLSQREPTPSSSLRPSPPRSDPGSGQPRPPKADEGSASGCGQLAGVASSEGGADESEKSSAADGRARVTSACASGSEGQLATKRLESGSPSGSARSSAVSRLSALAPSWLGGGGGQGASGSGGTRASGARAGSFPRRGLKLSAEAMSAEAAKIPPHLLLGISPTYLREFCAAHDIQPGTCTYDVGDIVRAITAEDGHSVAERCIGSTTADGRAASGRPTLFVSHAQVTLCPPLLLVGCFLSDCGLGKSRRCCHNATKPTPPSCTRVPRRRAISSSCSMRSTPSSSCTSSSARRRTSGSTSSVRAGPHSPDLTLRHTSFTPRAALAAAGPAQLLRTSLALACRGHAVGARTLAEAQTRKRGRPLRSPLSLAASCRAPLRYRNSLAHRLRAMRRAPCAARRAPRAGIRQREVATDVLHIGAIERHIGRVVAVLDPWHNPISLRRVWCVL